MDEVKELYPVFLDIVGRKCVVVGGGPVGNRRVRGLLDAGAKVELVSPAAIDELAQLSSAGSIIWKRREFQKQDLKDCWLAFAATNESGVNENVRKAARVHGALFNSAQSSVDTDFNVPSILRRGPLQVGISSGSPAFSRIVKEHLNSILGSEYEEFALLLSQLRPKVMDRFPDDPDRRRAVWDQLVNWETVALIRNGQMDQVEEMVSECLS